MDYLSHDSGARRSLTVYRVAASTDFGCLLAPDSDADFEYYTFDGRPRSAAWDRNKYVYENDGRGLRFGNFAEANLGTLTFDRFAESTVGSLLSTCGEILPIAVADHDDFYIFNCTMIVDALDEERSILKRFKDGRIMRVKRYAFVEQALPSTPFFRVTAFSSKLFCLSDSSAPERDFKTLAEQHALSGLVFQELWENNIVVT